ncbi:MAG: IS630 transposase-related protein [Peptococcaceae bacterium]|nr:IS630 transposase-related protein [Peptococcaceae bacterium]
MSYDEKYRRRAVAYKDSGHTFKELKEVFGILSCAYYQWRSNKEISGFYVLPETGKATRKRKIDADELRKIIEDQPDLFLKEIAQKFDCSIAAVHKRLEKMKITRKKRHLPIRKSPKKKERNISKS